jgi:hypothetical protein
METAERKLRDERGKKKKKKVVGEERTKEKWEKGTKE